MNRLPLLLLLSVLPAFAAGPDAPSARDQIARLDFLVGKWDGGGWIEYGGKRHEFTSTEEIRRKLDGEALLIEGLHTNFQALAVVTWSGAADVYDWHSFPVRGKPGRYEARLVRPGVLQWSTGKSRYTITIEGDRWHEIGERQTDDGAWRPFFEMRVARAQ